jgi:hypothetical protein
MAIASSGHIEVDGLDLADAVHAAAGPSLLVERLRQEGKVSFVANQVEHGVVP